MSKIKTVLKKCGILIRDELLYLKMAIFGIEVINSKTKLKKKVPESSANKMPEDSDAKTLWEEFQALPYDESNLGKVTIQFGGWRPPVNSSKDQEKKQ